MDPYLAVFWGLVLCGSLVGLSHVIAVWIETDQTVTLATAKLHDALASQEALSRSLAEADTEVVWLRAQMAGAGLQVGTPPEGDRTRRLVRATRDGVVVVQEGRP